MGGAVPVRDLLRMMEEAGFVECEFAGHTAATTSKYTAGALFRAKAGGA